MKLSTTILAASALAAGSAFAEPVAPGDVQFDDYGAVAESLTGKPGDPEKGAEVLSKRSLGNCVACHQISSLADVPFQGNSARRWTVSATVGTKPSCGASCPMRTMSIRAR